MNDLITMPLKSAQLRRTGKRKNFDSDRVEALSRCVTCGAEAECSFKNAIGIYSPVCRAHKTKDHDEVPETPT